MAYRKLQIYLSEEQYRYVRQRSRQRGSMAQVIRDLIDQAGRPDHPEKDPFYQHLVSEKEGSGQRYRADEAKDELYRQSR